MKFIDIENKENVPQTCIYKGELKVLGPKEHITVDSGLAEAFMNQCAGAVAISKEIEINETSDKTFQDNSFVWLANMTGDPDAKPTVKARGNYNKDRRDYDWVEVDNPKLTPRVLRRKFDLGEEEYRTVQGIFARNLGKETVILQPYKRMRLPKNVAEWFLERDSHGEEYNRGLCIASRAKSSFEPDGSWELDDIKLWVSLIEPTIAHKIRSEKQCSDEHDVLEEKKLALRRSYFLAANPKYPLPSRAKFDTFKKAQEGAGFDAESDAELEDDFMASAAAEVAAEAPRKRGRPRKEG